MLLRCYLRVYTMKCHEKVRSGCSNDQDEAPAFVTKCVLDIDIYKNRPKVHEHVKLPNPEVRLKNGRSLHMLRSVNVSAYLYARSA